MTSPLTSSCDALATGVIARLATAGYAFAPLTESFEAFLGRTYDGLVGGSGSKLIHGRSELLAGILTGLGGAGNTLTQSEATMMALIIDS